VKLAREQCENSLLGYGGPDCANTFDGAGGDDLIANPNLLPAHWLWHARLRQQSLHATSPIDGRNRQQVARMSEAICGTCLASCVSIPDVASLIRATLAEVRPVRRHVGELGLIGVPEHKASRCDEVIDGSNLDTTARPRDSLQPSVASFGIFG
jgi:hypothetical protein